MPPPPKLLPLLFRGLQAILAALGLFFAAVFFLPFHAPWTQLLSSPWSDTPGSTLIVLGAESIGSPQTYDVNNPPVIGLHTYWRCVYAIQEYRRGSYTQIVFSGGSGMSESMRDFAIGHGIPAAAIIIENRSQSTRDQALFVAPLLSQAQRKQGPIILLTSDFHSRRAHASFTRAGLATIARPIPDAAKRNPTWTQRWDVFQDLFLESLKSAYYAYRGWT